MLRTHLLEVMGLLINSACFAQVYSFISYTPKDGLVNSRVKSAFQDSRGRMYFLTHGGYRLKKDSLYSLTRLEKSSSAIGQQTGIMGRTEQNYPFEGSKSAVRFQGGAGLYFVFSTGSTVNTNKTSDSVMRANGMDPGMMKGMAGRMNDPASFITLYEAEVTKNGRKIVLMKMPGMNPFGSHKLQGSDKYTFSIKKIKEGYWELQADKTLPAGEYAFTVSNTGNMADMMTGSIIIFAFGID